MQETTLPVPCSFIQYEEKKHGTSTRLWQGCPTIAVTKGGKLFAGWYSGGSREPSLLNYNLLVESKDGGLTWSTPLLVQEGRAYDNIQVLYKFLVNQLQELQNMYKYRNYYLNFEIH